MFFDLIQKQFLVFKKQVLLSQHVLLVWLNWTKYNASATMSLQQSFLHVGWPSPWTDVRAELIIFHVSTIFDHF